MRYQHRILATELEKCLKSLFFTRRVFYHRVRNAGKLCDFGWYGTFRVYKCVERISSFTFHNTHCTNFCNAVIGWAKPCRFYVERNEFIVECFIRFSFYRKDKVIDIVGFHTVNNLNWLTLFLHVIRSVHRIRKSLCNTVVGNSNGWMTPLGCTAHKIASRVHTIHCRHTAVHMKLHALLFGSVCYLNLVYCGNSTRAQNNFMVVFVILHGSAHQNGCALCKGIEHLTLICHFNYFQCDGASIVRNINRVNFALLVTRYLLLGRKDLTPCNYTANVWRYLPDWDRFCRFADMAINFPCAFRNHARQKSFTPADIDDFGSRFAAPNGCILGCHFQICLTTFCFGCFFLLLYVNRVRLMNR